MFYWIPDVYLLGTVMLVFGMGLYELFVSNLDLAKQVSEGKAPSRSSLFGLFALKVSLILLNSNIFYSSAMHVMWCSSCFIEIVAFLTSGKIFISPVGWELYPLACHNQMICYLTLDLPKNRRMREITFAIHGVAACLCRIIENFSFYLFLAGTTEMVRSENC